MTAGPSTTTAGRAQSTMPLMACAFSTAGAATAVSGGFSGPLAPVIAVAAGLVGVASADRIIARRTLPATVLSLSLVVGLGTAGMATAGVSAMADGTALLRDAVSSADLARPPVPFDAGWRGLVAALMGAVGLSCTWLARSTGRALTGVAVTVPFVAVGAISIPTDLQAVIAAVVVGLLALAMAVATADEAVVDLAPADTRRLHLRSLARAIPVAALLGVAVAAAASLDVLFPDPLVTPTREARLPATSPVGDDLDRVLFTVDGGFSGPFRIGVLDVFEAADSTWRLAPLDDRPAVPIGSDGLVDDLPATFRVDIEVLALEGLVLPTVPRTTGIVAPDLPGVPSHDVRAGTIELTNGRLEPGLAYTLAVAAQPTDADLRQALDAVPEPVAAFTRITPPPPSAQAIIDEVGRIRPWARFLALRQRVLDEVPASGPGLPAPMGDVRVEELLRGQPGSPFELTALQVMLARWSGLPARIGFGFDCGSEGTCAQEQTLYQITPLAGAVFPEVWFSGHGWVPVTGSPQSAALDQPAGGASLQIVPADVGLQEELFLPSAIPGRRVVPPWAWWASLAIAMTAISVPTARLVARHRRESARRAGRRADATSPENRIKVAYLEWREEAVRLGVGGPGDPPLAFLKRIEDDPDHEELAWLVVRAGYGDRRGEVTDADADHAEALAATLVTRLRAARPPAERLAALVDPERGR